MSTTLSVQEAADTFGVSKRTLDTWLKEGTFPTSVYKIKGRWIIPAYPIFEMLGIPTDKIITDVQSVGRSAA